MLKVEKKKQYFWILFLLLTGAYFLLKYLGVNVIEGIFETGRLDFLNRISGVKENKSLDFYIGHLHDRFIGPACQVISSLPLIYFSLKYLTASRKFIFGLSIFVYLVITKWEALFFPCYGEVGSGPVTEGIWLFRNSFDYRGLLNQLNVDSGGPKVYMFSMYPSYVAALLKLIPSIKVFYITYHLNMFALAAVVIALFKEMVGKIFGNKVGVLGAILLLSLPLFQTIVELVNMEMLCLFFLMLSMYFLSLKRIIPASILAVLASLAKGPGGIATAACFFVGVLLFLFDKEERFKFKNIAFGAMSFLLGASKLYLLRTYVSPQQTPAGTIRMFIGLPNIKGCPLILIVFALAMMATIFVFIKELISKKKKKEIFFFRHYTVGIAFTISALWIGLYLNVSVMGPRYKFILAPFLLLCFIFYLTTFIRSRKSVEKILIFAIGIVSLGSYGLYYKNKIKSSTYSFNNLERSLEYRNDLFLDMHLVKILNEKYPFHLIGAPYVIGQILTMPELGYVKIPRDVVMYGMAVYYEKHITNFKGLNQMDYKNTIWVGFESKKIKEDFYYPIDLEFDKIIEKLEVGDKELFLFQGGFAIRRMFIEYYRQLERVYKLKGKRNK